MINIKTIRKFTDGLLSLIYLSPFKNIFLWVISRVPFNSIARNFWINSPNYYLDSFKKFVEKLKKANISIRNKSILEIGSGGSIGWGYIFMILGAKSYTASDKLRSFNMSQKSLNSEIKLIRLVENKYQHKIANKYVKVKDNKLVLLAKKLNFQIIDITSKKINRTRKYDLLISNAVLEHLPKKKISTAVKNMKDLLKTRGRMLHQIDLRDHYNLQYPFNFYEYSEKSWNDLTRKGFFYTNRLRSSDYQKIFLQNGFKITYLSRKVTDNNLTKVKINKIFQKYPEQELKTEGLTIALIKV